MEFSETTRASEISNAGISSLHTSRWNSQNVSLCFRNSQFITLDSFMLLLNPKSIERGCNEKLSRISNENFTLHSRSILDTQWLKYFLITLSIDNENEHQCPLDLCALLLKINNSHQRDTMINDKSWIDHKCRARERETFLCIFSIARIDNV
jgi:hypothetical protein